MDGQTDRPTDGGRSRKYVIISSQVLRPYLTMYVHYTCGMPFVTSLKLVFFSTLNLFFKKNLNY